ncbi:MAG: SNF2-related protein [Spirochaetota bacterium]
MIAFDEATMQRGIHYYFDDRVTYLRAEGNTVVALVAGSRRSPYTVFLNTDQPEESRCTCPVGHGCKHLVATIATVLEGRLNNARVERALEKAVNLRALSQALDDFDGADYGGVSFEPEEEVVEYVVELQDRVDGARVGRPGRAADAHLRVVDDESHAGWRAVIAIGTDYERRPVVCLARQYRRKNGSYGRLDRVPPGEPLYVPDARALPLVERLDALGGVAPLVAFADELYALELPLFEATPDRLSGGHDRPVVLARPERLELQVEPVPSPRDYLGRTIGPPEAGIALALTVHADTGDERYTIGPGSTCSVALGMGRSVVFVPGGLVLIAEPRMQLAAIGPYLRYDWRLSVDDVAALRQIVATSPDLLSLRFPARVRVVTVDPEPCFVLTETFRGITVRLEAGRLPEDGYVGDEFRVHRATTGIPREAWMAGAEVVGEPPFRDSQTGGWLWQVSLDESDRSVASIALPLMGQGFDVYLEDPTRSRRRLRLADHFAVTVSSGTDWFGPTVRDAAGVEVDWRQLEMMGARGRYRDGDELVLLDPADSERIRRLLDLVDGNADGRTPHADLTTLLEMADLADEVDPDLDAIRSFAEEILSGAQTAPAAPPPGLTATLRPYQLEGYAWLGLLARHRLSGCLADDMGLGKTVQALALMLLLRTLPREEASGDPSRHCAPFSDSTPNPPSGEPAEASLPPGGALVVAPVSTLRNWEREAERFAPDLVTRVHHGPQRCASTGELASYDLVVTSYATAVRDADLLGSLEWRLLVLDEAQFIKNPHARTTRRLKTLSSTLRLCLTGTPVENVTTDLWSIMDFLVPGLLGTLAGFSRRFPKRNVAESESAANRLDRLRRIVSPFLLRRTKEAVAPELPPRVETVLTCEMGPKQARFYETLRMYHHDRVQEAIESGDRSEIGAAIFTGLLRLRQAALYPEDADRTGAGVPSAKEEELLDQLEEVVSEGHRAIVFSQFVSALTRMREAAVRREIDTLYFDGQTRDRTSLIDRFQRSDSPLVFFISLKAGGTGINLTAADNVFICDPWWNPQVERQAVDRAHRIGRTRPVMVTRLVTTRTVEEKVLMLQDQKRRLATDLIAEDTGGIDTSDAAELLSLFERDS